MNYGVHDEEGKEKLFVMQCPGNDKKAINVEKLTQNEFEGKGNLNKRLLNVSRQRCRPLVTAEGKITKRRCA